MTRKDILAKAESCVCGQRETDYGSPEDNFQKIADLWTAYRGEKFTAVDVAMMMGLLKIARISTGRQTEDSFVDLAGYAACGGEIATEQKLTADASTLYAYGDPYITVTNNTIKEDICNESK